MSDKDNPIQQHSDMVVVTVRRFNWPKIVRATLCVVAIFVVAFGGYALVNRNKDRDIMANTSQAQSQPVAEYDYNKQIQDSITNAESKVGATEQNPTTDATKGEAATDYNNLGDAYINGDKADEAIVAYKKALDLAPEGSSQQAEANRGLMDSYSEKGRYAEAIVSGEALKRYYENNLNDNPYMQPKLEALENDLNRLREGKSL